jgi:hypothetical protein
MSARIRFLTLALMLAACSGEGGEPAGPGPLPLPEQPGDPAEPGDPTEPGEPQPGIQGTYVLAQINQSQPGQLVSIQNPDGFLIGLYRFEATSITLDALQTFVMALRYTDDKTTFDLEDAGEFKQAGPVTGGALPLTFTSEVYGDSFTGIVLDGVVAIQYDFDGDGRLDTSFAFQRAD